jgi:hypothetical protein
MESPAFTTSSPVPVGQRELLGLIMGCAGRGSATFTQAEFAVVAAGGGPEARALTRELLTDLSIRGWIELRVRRAGGNEAEVERRRWEFEFAADRNWDEAVPDRACYALTDTGRGRLLRTTQR